MANTNDVEKGVKAGEDYAHKIVDKASDKAEEIIDSASKVASKGINKAEDLIDSSKDKSSHLKNKWFGYVSENPWKSVAVGAVAALVIAKLFN